MSDSAILVRGGRQRINVFSATLTAAAALPAGKWEKFDVRVSAEPWATLWYPHDPRPGPLLVTDYTTDAGYDPQSPDPNNPWYGAAWSLVRPLGGLWWPLGWLAGAEGGGKGWWLSYEVALRELRWRAGTDWDGGDVTDGSTPSATVTVWGVPQT